MERRSLDRLPTSVPVEVKKGDRTWRGTCINLSSEGALLKLEGRWDDQDELELYWVHEGRSQIVKSARVVRDSSPDGAGTFMAVRFN